MTPGVPVQIPSNFGAYLKRLLDERDMAPKTLAWKIGVHPSYVRDWLRGDKLPPRDSNHPTTIVDMLQLTTEERRNLIAALMYQHELRDGEARGTATDKAHAIALRIAGVWWEEARAKRLRQALQQQASEHVDRYKRFKPRDKVTELRVKNKNSASIELEVEHLDSNGKHVGIKKLRLQPKETQSVISPPNTDKSVYSPANGIEGYITHFVIDAYGAPILQSISTPATHRTSHLLLVVQNHSGFETDIMIANYDAFEPINAYLEFFTPRVKGLLGKRIYGIEEIRNIRVQH